MTALERFGGRRFDREPGQCPVCLTKGATAEFPSESEQGEPFRLRCGACGYTWTGAAEWALRWLEDVEVRARLSMATGIPPEWFDPNGPPTPPHRMSAPGEPPRVLRRRRWPQVPDSVFVQREDTPGTATTPPARPLEPPRIQLEPGEPLFQLELRNGAVIRFRRATRREVLRGQYPPLELRAGDEVQEPNPPSEDRTPPEEGADP